MLLSGRSLWARRCVSAKRRTDQSLFGIVQGGLDPALRVESARDLVSRGIRWVCRRRIIGGRGQGRHVCHVGCDSARTAISQAALSHGCGHAGGSRRRGGARD